MTVNQTPTSLNKALFLISHSPFKASLPAQFSSDANYNDLSLSLDHAAQADEFSDIMKFQRIHKSSDTAHIEGFHNAISSKVLNQTDSEIGDSLRAELSEDITSIHLKIKFLCEFALSQIPRDVQLLPFEELIFIKKKLQQQREIKEEIESQVQGNAKLINNILSKDGAVNEEDLMMLRGLTTTNEQLLIKLGDVSNDMQKREKTIESQYLLALKVAYFEDLDLENGVDMFSVRERTMNDSTVIHTNNINNNTSINNATPGSNGVARDVQTEQLLSYIVSLVVQRNIPLPVPDDHAADSQNKWAKDCVDALLNASEVSSDGKKLLPSPTGSISKDSAQLKLEHDHKELKTAMSDLQFAHQFLTRQFEEERTLNNQVIQNHLKKQKSLENKLAENIIILEKSTQKSILIEHEKNILESQLSDRIKEIQSLQRQLSDLKLSTLGIPSSTNSSSPYSQTNSARGLQSPDQTHLTSFNTTVNQDYPSSASPVTGISINLEPSHNLSRNGSISHPPHTPILHQSSNNHLNTPTSNSSSANGSTTHGGERTSVSLMRNEFKRMYKDLQTQHEELLTREVDERKRLERLVAEYRSAENDGNFL
ncbi:hypothetical protein WICPIJ_006155 [Wickerhamomyces pijperi]|uniref:Up-regulated during septation protein 1 domain-containing protein n=1 Tax=Wickerhamomyces pijperi TaxID=599730 RepID=A0A9P8Q276_WICPI|nr:hypothetical protein WICPIJ_006155 [Wickerhamomyces pijperi]